MISYSKEEILTELKGLLESDIKCLYSNSLINTYGSTKDSNSLYSEEISNYLLNNYIENASITGIETITREKSYFTESHNKLFENITDGSNRDEENYVKSLFFYNPLKSEIGTAIDYQIPLKSRQADKLGKIDLLTYKEDTNELFLIEVKFKKSCETALRCCLEIQTYYQTVDKEKLINDYFEAGKIKTQNPTLRKAIIVFKNSNPACEFEDVTRVNLKKLVEEFNIKVCFV